MFSVQTLSAEWRERADLLERHGAAEAGATCRALAAELDAACTADADAELTLREAAAVSGYSERRLRELIAEGAIENAGRRGAPRIRRADLPRRARPNGASAYDAAADAAELAGRINRNKGR